MHLAKSAKTALSSNAVRNTFLDFFCKEKNHRLVRSSPVLPYGDPTLAFCNAGMNQFKSVLLGSSHPPGRRVANSQKCVRVGGKHNDLAQVGGDGTHHTFFEMLGNWSFGDYFKREACEMAWELLTGPYGLRPSSLYVTYFGGDQAMNLAPDLETRDIWRSIGVAEDKILAGSVAENFWEMGETGPCGGCTEIHYHPGTNPSTGQLLELWNLVFIEYNRTADGTLNKLSTQNVDTGMGFERLLAVLQRAKSNYDTDLFVPLFHSIEKSTGRAAYTGCYGNQDNGGLDTAYRVLADHSRMITVCLADGFYPDQENKLRGIIRKALTVSRDVFNKEHDLLKELSDVVAEVLGEAYPEISRNLNRVHYIIDHEAELLRTLRKDRLSDWTSLCSADPSLFTLPVAECPNLLPAYIKLKESFKSGIDIPVQVLWKTCETYGVPQNLAPALVRVFGQNLDETALETHITKIKLDHRKEMYASEAAAHTALLPQIMKELRGEGVPITKDRFKYQYLYGFEGEAKFAPQSANIVAIIADGQCLDFISPELLMVGDCRVGVILDRTNLYSEAGGQASDHGTLTLGSGEVLRVENVTQSEGYVVHWVTTPLTTKFGLRVNEECTVHINENRRKVLMNNHTATHLLNSSLRQILKLVDQKSSRVYPHKLVFDFSVYRENLTSKDLKSIENTIKRVIVHNVPVKRTAVSSSDLINVNMVTTLPGETYHHDSLHLIEVDSGFFFSREPCCGTHALQTGDLNDFVITNYKNISSSVKSIQGVTGEHAAQAKLNLKKFKDLLRKIQVEVDELLRNPLRCEKEVEKLDKRLAEMSKSVEETELLSFYEAEILFELLERLRTQLKYSARETLRSSMEEEMKQLLTNNHLKFIVHNLECASVLDTVPLAKASRMCASLPSFILAGSKGVYKARCCVPKELVSADFSAELWMRDVSDVVRAECGPPKGQDPSMVCNMKAKKLSHQELAKAIEIARERPSRVFKS